MFTLSISQKHMTTKTMCFNKLKKAKKCAKFIKNKKSRRIGILKLFFNKIQNLNSINCMESQEINPVLKRSNVSTIIVINL